MPVRSLLRFLSQFANNEQIVSRLAESRLIRRPAQFFAYLYHHQANSQPNVTFKQRFDQELKHEMEKMKERQKDCDFLK
ncbi:hypothetical protein BLOT_013715 [Blomia tropicalis]|nr:hypothetical protein BLOT_013715 [Blomia tropicalis]